ncbi:hypothetical protein [Tunturiibacter gelidiferens]|uniref:hypothetical protein n=1 Tax=Tunturiibacter gelidiferens TaxID=3069689 RepID=UPI003D9B7068
MTTLSVTGAAFAFLLLASATGYPLTFEQSLRILEIILPVFLGYLASASVFGFRSRSGLADVRFRSNVAGISGLLVRGPIVILGIALVADFVAFGISNRPNGVPGTGISFDMFAGSISTILGLLAVTTNFAVAYLFGSEG